MFDYKPFNRKLIDSELAFIHILERIYGSLETDTQFEVYTEYSKIISVVEILDTPVHELIKRV